MTTHTRSAIPAPTPGPDPLPELRAARAFLLRLAEPPCAALEFFITEVGPGEAAERIRRDQAPESVTRLLPRARVHAAATRVSADAEAAARCGAALLIPEDEPLWPGAALAESTAEAFASLFTDAPARLAGGPAAPVALWVRGHGVDLMQLRAGITLTGSRAASSYGTHAAAELAAELAAAGRTIVCGAGFGIDAAAARGALAAGGATVAVLACGIDRVYPAAHEGLLERVAERGLLVSEYPPGTVPSRARCLARARLLAAFGEATVVVEAGPRSGALRTAADAAAFGRAVMAVPGPITSASTGAHQLIRAGATLVTSGDDVLAAIAEQRPDRGEHTPPHQPGTEASAKASRSTR